MSIETSASLAQAKADWLRVQYDFAYLRVVFAAARYRTALLRQQQKHNPYHDEVGRFTTPSGSVASGTGGGAGDTPAAGDANSQVAQAEGDGGPTLNSPAKGTNQSSEITSRGKFRTNTLSDVWNSAEPGPNGGRMCSSGCGSELMVPPNTGQARDWDMSHNPSWSNRTFPSGTSRPDVREDYQRGIQLECSICNRAGGNNDGRFSKPQPLSEGSGGYREVPPLSGGGGGGKIVGKPLRTNQ